MLTSDIIRNIEDIAAENVRLYGPLTDQQIETQANFEFEAGDNDPEDRDEFVSAYVRGAEREQFA